MKKPKLILLNGFAGSGKTTIAKKYISEHPMAVVIEGDELIVNIGGWLAHEDEARSLIFDLTKAMLRVCLEAGRDVVLPYLVTDHTEVQQFEMIASELNAKLYEVVLYRDRPEAIAQLFKRGTWGEADQPPLNDQDLPVIEELIVKMEKGLKERADMVKINVKEDDPEDTYNQLMGYLRK